MYNKDSYEYVSDLVRYFHAETVAEMEQILDKKNIKANVKDSDNNNAFFYVDTKEIAAIDFLVSKKVSLTEISKSSAQTPLFMTKNINKLKKLASYGVIDINKQDNSGTPFFMKNSMTEIVGPELDFFIEKGLDISQIAKTGFYSLSFMDMSKKGNVSFMLHLLKNNYVGDNIDEFVETIVEEKKKKWSAMIFDPNKIEEKVNEERFIWKEIKTVHEKKLLSEATPCLEKANIIVRI